MDDIVIKGHHFEMIEQFKYLEEIISCSNRENMYTNNQISYSNKCMMQYISNVKVSITEDENK